MVDDILDTLRKNNISQNYIYKTPIKDIFIHWLNINSRSYIENARQWFDSKLRDIERDSEKTESGAEANAAGKARFKRDLETKEFGITIEQFIKNNYKK